MSRGDQDFVLVVDDNIIFRNSLAEWLRDLGYEVIAAETGEIAFVELRGWPRRIGWLYSRARLPGLICGWILADEYHDIHPHRAAVLTSTEAKTSSQGHIILQDPSLAAVLEALLQQIDQSHTAQAVKRHVPEYCREAA
ncbi:hypothetical protein IC232_27180 [Microvirga sp. BT688]|uniref:hypothetical protein n=1 Tax=Microvirga sp. TaxID=1873136 RepID=UPI0016855E82|nr:hypothetical protein [Microvirga sp.]MBD2750347.1 hypothetical protein [Microvirga sp.]